MFHKLFISVLCNNIVLFNQNFIKTKTALFQGLFLRGQHPGKTNIKTQIQTGEFHISVALI